MKFAAEVQEYLSVCARNPQIDRRYHPTEDGAVKMVWHHGKAEADAIKDAFAEITGKKREEVQR